MFEQLSIVSLFTLLLDGDNTDFVGLFWGINEVNVYEKLTIVIFKKYLLILYFCFFKYVQLVSIVALRSYINLSDTQFASMQN